MDSYDIIKQRIQKNIDSMDLELSEYQYKQIYQYYSKLVEWNQVMNLTAITDEIEFADKHVFDSILLQNSFNLGEVESLIDIGTGAGLPGLILKIVFPHLEVLLVDSLHKRISFLNEVIELMEIDDIAAIQGRAEDLGKDENFREKYDVCVSRAVSQLPILSEYCIPFVKVGGNFIAYKSISTDTEIEDSLFAIGELGGSLTSSSDYELIKNEIARRFVIINKISETPQRYPRKAGIPQKRPLMAKK